MRILVTGGTGFLGKALAKRLVSEGHSVTALGRNIQVGNELQRDGIEFVQGNLEDEKLINCLCREKDYVFHSGALSAPWGKYTDFYQANVTGTKNIIAGCEKNDVRRLIHVSTPSIYFYYNDRMDVKEDAKLPEKFVNHYAKTKYLAEEEIDKAFKKGLPVVTIRPRALFGPGDTTIIPRLIQVNKKRFIPLIDGGKAIMDLTYVENVVDALLLCMDAPDHALGKKYNITNGENIIFKDILEKLFHDLGEPMRTKEISYQSAMKLAGVLEWASKTFFFGKEPTLTRYTVSVLAKNQTLDIEAARRDLGYRPNISIEEGIQRFVEWWKNND